MSIRHAHVTLVLMMVMLISGLQIPSITAHPMDMPTPTSTINDPRFTTPTPASESTQTSDAPQPDARSAASVAEWVAPLQPGCTDVECTFTLGDANDDAGNLYTCDDSAHHNEIYLGECIDEATQEHRDISSGWRFPNVTLPKGTKISKAYFEFQIDGPYTKPITTQFVGEKVVNPANFESSLPSARRLSSPLTAPVAWTIAPPWRYVTPPTLVRSPDIAPIIRELLAQPGWNATATQGQPMVFLAYDPPGLDNAGVHRRVMGWERTETNGAWSARLVVELESMLRIDITDADGQPVDALMLNADGWPVINKNNPQAIANPLTVTVTVRNTDPTIFATFPYLVVETHSLNDRGRFATPTVSPVISSGNSCSTQAIEHSHSIQKMTAQCTLGAFPVNTSRTYTWQLWVQPSEETQILFDAHITNLVINSVSRQAQVYVPLAHIHPVVFIPGITSTLPPSYPGPRNIGTTLDGANVVAGYNQLYQGLERLGYERNRTYFVFPYDWLESHLTSAKMLKEQVLDPESATAAVVPYVAGAPSPSLIKFDLIGHSGGAVVARTYMQSPSQGSDATYIGKVRRIVSFAGPHLGLLEAYVMAEDKEDENPPLAATTSTFTELRATQKGYVEQICPPLPNGNPCMFMVTQDSLYSYLHDPKEGPRALPELLPVFGNPPYLIGPNDTKFPFGRIANPLFESQYVQPISSERIYDFYELMIRVFTHSSYDNAVVS